MYNAVKYYSDKEAASMAQTKYNDKLNASKVVQPKVNISSVGTKAVLPAYEYDKLIKTIPVGLVVTADKMRMFLAAKFKAMECCPLTTNSALMLVANASEERNGVNPTPYWRVLKSDGGLNDKYPGGDAAQKARLEAEGHAVVGEPGSYYLNDIYGKYFTFRM